MLETYVYSKISAERVEIPRALLLEARADPFTGCHVSLSRTYVPLLLDGVIVGFCNPRRESFGWRVGPLYVRPTARRAGVASAWMRGFPARPMVSFVVHANEASARFHDALGFVPWRRNKWGTFWRLE